MALSRVPNTLMGHEHVNDPAVATGIENWDAPARGRRDWTEVVREARQRCNQENLIEQLKNGVRALRAPVNTLAANWAYMVMASLAWSLKAWVALVLPVLPRWEEKHRHEQLRLLRMDFRTFLNHFVNVPAQVIKTGRRTVLRLLAWRPWLPAFFRFLDAT